MLLSSLHVVDALMTRIWLDVDIFVDVIVLPISKSESDSVNACIKTHHWVRRHPRGISANGAC